MMSEKTEYNITLKDKLTIIHAEDTKLIFSAALAQGHLIGVDLSQLESIDIIGLQLLISFFKESQLLGKSVQFLGIFTDRFKEDLNRVSFSSQLMVNGEDFMLLIKEII